jgi:EAL and modified HD-GYP domain-containing signal transduction protein
MDHPVLGQFVLAYGALFDVKRAPVANRLTLHPLNDGAAEQAQGLVELLADGWPAERGLLALNPTGEALLQALLDSDLPPHVVLELPAFMAGDASQLDRLLARKAAGASLALKGRPLAPLPPQLAGAFKHVIVDLSEERRQAEASPAHLAARNTPWVQSGVMSVQQAAEALKRGAWAVQGWPLTDPPAASTGTRKVQASVQVVMDLIQRVDREEPIPKLEAVLRGDPTLAFRLMRLINSPAFGLSVEISSFQHAIMMLGYQRLKRWLALLLTSAVNDPDLKPLMTLAVRRGLLMEELARVHGDDSMRSEAFICGVFSLLDRMLGEPFERLLATLPVAEGVAQTLTGQDGPHSSALALACAVESELPHDILEASDAMLLGRHDLNKAILKTLLASRQMQVD